MLITFICFYFSKTTIQSFNQSLQFIVRVILPSLFPFMIFINFILLGNTIDLLAKVCKPIGSFFHLSGYGMICIIGSLLGGFPYSAILVSSFIKSEKLSDDEGLAILKFAFFPSFSFLFSGLYHLNASFQKEVLWICLSLYLSSFLGLFLHNLKKTFPEKKFIPNEISFINLYFEVMNKTIQSIFAISFCIVFFTIIKGYLSLWITQPQCYFLISGILEFSSTSSEILLQSNVSFFDLIILCFILSFSSFSIFFQSAFYLKDVSIGIKKLIIPRLLVSVGALLFYLLFHFLF